MPAFTVPKGKEAVSVNSSHFQQCKNTSTRYSQGTENSNPTPTSIFTGTTMGCNK